MTAVQNYPSNKVSVFINEDSLKHYYLLLKNMRENSSRVINPLLKLNIYIDEECLIESEVLK